MTSTSKTRSLTGPKQVESRCLWPASPWRITTTWRASSVRRRRSMTSTCTTRRKDVDDGSHLPAWCDGAVILFAGCEEGKAVVMDAAHGGAVLATASAGRRGGINDSPPPRPHLSPPAGGSAAARGLLARTT